MAKTKWFMIGVILTMFTVDWARARIENSELRKESYDLRRSKDAYSESSKSCLGTLTEVKDMLENASLRSQVLVLNRAHSMNLFERARNGDESAIQDLMDLGLEVPKPRPQLARSTSFGSK